MPFLCASHRLDSTSGTAANIFFSTAGSTVIGTSPAVAAPPGCANSDRYTPLPSAFTWIVYFTAGSPARSSEKLSELWPVPAQAAVVNNPITISPAIRFNAVSPPPSGRDGCDRSQSQAHRPHPPAAAQLPDPASARP